MVKINWSEKARIDLINIYNYIYYDSKYYASKTLIEIINSSDILKLFPNSGRKVPEFQSDNIRELIYKSYRIIYVFNSNIIKIHRIWHSARLLSKEIIS